MFSPCWVEVISGAKCCLATSFNLSFFHSSQGIAHCTGMEDWRPSCALQTAEQYNVHCSLLRCNALQYMMSAVFHIAVQQEGALVDSGYGTPYGGQDMAGGEKQCSRRSRRSSSRSRREEKGRWNLSPDSLLPPAS